MQGLNSNTTKRRDVKFWKYGSNCMGKKGVGLGPSRANLNREGVSA
jgi:hypothetical protein